MGRCVRRVQGQRLCSRFAGQVIAIVDGALAVVRMIYVHVRQTVPRGRVFWGDSYDLLKQRNGLLPSLTGALAALMACPQI